MDYKKPTRLLSDILSVKDFGFHGWPRCNYKDIYQGPLPQDCGHKHFKQLIGQNAKGESETSSTAAYPPKMCEFLAMHISRWFMELGGGKVISPVGVGRSSLRRRDSTDTAPPSSSSIPPSARKVTIDSSSSILPSARKVTIDWSQGDALNPGKAKKPGSEKPGSELENISVSRRYPTR